MRYIWAAIAAILIFPILIVRKKKQEAVINREDLFNRNANQNELRIRYLYLEDKKKSGDAILIQSPDGYTMLLDSGDRKSTRLNSSHVSISYAVFCLKKKRN